MRWYLGLLASMFVALPAAAETFRSPQDGANLVELYTSEGCSSCPPADRWLAAFADDPALFHTLFPLAFHVDYWNRLGWPDRFSSSRYTDRQREYTRKGHLRQVYTPGLVVNGSEWRGWFSGQDHWRQPPLSTGTLVLEYQAPALNAHFDGELAGEPVLHLAYLGMGLETEVTRGENRGKRLRHEFVVLDYRQYWGHGGRWALQLPVVPDRGQQRTALVAWVSRADDPAPVQAAGGFIRGAEDR